MSSTLPCVRALVLKREWVVTCSIWTDPVSLCLIWLGGFIFGSLNSISSHLIWPTAVMKQSHRSLDLKAFVWMAAELILLPVCFCSSVWSTLPWLWLKWSSSSWTLPLPPWSWSTSSSSSTWWTACGTKWGQHKNVEVCERGMSCLMAVPSGGYPDHHGLDARRLWLHVGIWWSGVGSLHLHSAGVLPGGPP